eukprot:m.51991 g.51991  ORF g.51991 m.51991 type:complete len:548 (+) comp13472_c0_seq1:114-1757(+)
MTTSLVQWLVFSCLVATGCARSQQFISQAVGSEVIVETKAGSLAGKQMEEVDYFLGVPFGKPPINELRWTSPAPAESWTGVRKAHEFGPDCSSDKSDYVNWNTSEDCLYLNVYRPAASNTAPLPVMVWFYGGSWEFGGSSFFLYDGHGIVTKGNVIVVTVNYRMMMFGFMASPELKAEDPNGSTGNYGMQDQRLAMQWVQDNIAAFGGDPNNVTIFGQSAGGGSVTAHLVMPKSSGLFQRAIIESGPPSDWNTMELNQSYAHTTLMASQLNCSQYQGKDWLNCMRSLSVEELVAHRDEPAEQVISWAPIIDGVELTTTPSKLWEQGKINPVTGILLGTVQDEGTEFLEYIHYKDNASAYNTWLPKRFQGQMIEAVNKTYPVTIDTSAFFSANRVFTDALMACPARRGADWATKQGIEVYLYHFTHLVFLINLAEPSWRIGHSSEVPFVWHDGETLLGPGELAFGTAITNYWTNFAATGNPNTPSALNPAGTVPDVAWDAYDPSKHSYLNLNLTMSMQDDYIGSTYCDFWDGWYNQGCNVNDFPVTCA